MTTDRKIQYAGETDIVANVTVRNVSMNNAQNGARIKVFGGSREPLDVCHYVETNQRLVKDRHSADWLVNNSDIVKEI